MATRKLGLTQEPRVSVKALEAPLSLSERFLRGALLAGFIAVLLIEAYLIWQGVQLF